MPFSDQLRAAGDPIWSAQHEHPFVCGIGDGSLEPEKFRHYIRQDYLFLLEYARLLALGCARAPEAVAMRRFAQLAEAVLTRELELHRSYAGEWGITTAELERGRPTLTTRAYTDFLLRVAALGDYGELVAALLPCMWGYHEVATQLAERGRPNNALYASWIDAYSDAKFGELAAWCRILADEASESSSRHRMLEAFLNSSRYELAFWDASWHAEPPLLGPDIPLGSAPAV
jgi:thiaminase/transcriptional activator TenA